MEAQVEAYHSPEAVARRARELQQVDADADKLRAERARLDREAKWHPWVAAASILGAFVAGAALALRVSGGGG